jgi:uncharacterized protein (TIRG00374 family)
MEKNGTKLNNPATDSMKRRTPFQIGRSLVALLLLGLAVHLLLPQLTQFKHSLQVLQNMVWWAVGLSVVAQVLSYLGSGYMLQAIVRVVDDRMTLTRGVLITLASWSLGLVAGGTAGIIAGTYRWSRESGVSAEGATLAGWLPNLLNTGALILVSIFGLIHLLFVHQLSMLQVFGFGLMFLLLVLIVGSVAWGMRHRESLTNWVVRRMTGWAKFFHRKYDPIETKTGIEKMFQAWDTLREGEWKRPLLGTVFNFGFDMLSLYFLFIAAGHAVNPGVLLIGYGLPLLLGKTPFLPGGVGIVEGSMAALYSGLGVPDEVAVVVILSYRALSFWLPSLIGFPVILYLQHTRKEVGHAS